MTLFLVLVVILLIIGFLLYIGAALRSEKDRQNRIFEKELIRRQSLLDNQLNENKNEAEVSKDVIEHLPTKKNPDYSFSLAHSQN